MQDKRRRQFEKYKLRKQNFIIKNSYIPKVIRRIIRPLLRIMLKVSRALQSYRIEIMRKAKIPHDKPVIFAVSHIG